MKTPQNEVQVIYNNVIRQQYMGKSIYIVMTKADHAAIHKKVQHDIDKVAQAAGVEMLKTARILTRRGMREKQEISLKELNKLLQEIRKAKDHKDVITQTGIATGYANAMYHLGLMSEGELKDVIVVIGQAGEQTARQIKAEKRPLWTRIIRKKVRT